MITRSGEVRMLSGKSPEARRRIVIYRLLSSHLVRRANRLASRALAWARTLQLEIRSFYFHIREVHRKDLVGRFGMGPACLSCQHRGTQYRCKATQAGIRHMQQLYNLHPWLSYSDSSLLLEGWSLAFQLMPDSLDCGNSSDLVGAVSLSSSGE